MEPEFDSKEAKGSARAVLVAPSKALRPVHAPTKQGRFGPPPESVDKGADAAEVARPKRCRTSNNEAERQRESLERARLKELARRESGHDEEGTRVRGRDVQSFLSGQTLSAQASCGTPMMLQKTCARKGGMTDPASARTMSASVRASHARRRAWKETSEGEECTHRSAGRGRPRTTRTGSCRRTGTLRDQV